MTNVLRHPSVATSVGAGVLLAGGTLLVDVPWWLWAAWAALAAVSVGQAVRDGR